MRELTIVYTVFGCVAAASLVLDLLILNKKNAAITTRKALYQTFFWISVAFAFFFFLLMNTDSTTAFAYLSGYLMEWSLSVDNIFVFILIFSAFQVKNAYAGRVLLTGILMAIVFRVLFITLGVVLVEKFHGLLYLFGVFLLYTGYKMFNSTKEEEFQPRQSAVYRFLRKIVPLSSGDGDGKYMFKRRGRRIYTSLFAVVVLLAAIDLVFALDSIPAIMGITQNRMVIYTSNIFAVLGLRSLFFLLRGAVSKFDFLQQGVAFILFFIGFKMLAAHWLDQWIGSSTQLIISLSVILSSIAISIIYSIYHSKKGMPKDRPI